MKFEAIFWTSELEDSSSDPEEYVFTKQVITDSVEKTRESNLSLPVVLNYQMLEPPIGLLDPKDITLVELDRGIGVKVALSITDDILSDHIMTFQNYFAGPYLVVKTANDLTIESARILAVSVFTGGHKDKGATSLVPVEEKGAQHDGGSEEGSR